MKRVVLFLLYFISLLPLLAQTGYHVKNEFVELVPQEFGKFYVQTISTAESTKKSSFQSRLMLKAVDPQMINSTSAIINTRIADSDEVYQSPFYEVSTGGKVIVLPRVVVKLTDKKVLDNILKSCDGKLSLRGEVVNNRCCLNAHVHSSEQVLELVSLVEKMDGVMWCEPDMCGGAKLQNTYYGDQYYLHNIGQNGGTYGIDINVEDAWQYELGSTDIVVAVIDSGVDFNHEDLTGNVLSGYTCGNPSGFGAPVAANSIDPKAHGTACAGIIAANNNSIGIRGVANVSILPINIFPNFATTNYSGIASNSEIAEAILWAADRADILSNSWYVVSYSQDIADAIDYAATSGRNGKGCVVVAASGNSGGSSVLFPANLDNVIAVGAVNKNGSIWSYSCRGEKLNLVAPSGNIDIQGDVVTTDRMNSAGYTSGNYVTTFGGTSAACPQVAGVAALLLSYRPLITGELVKRVLEITARDLGTEGKDNTYGYGLVDAGAAFELLSKTYEIAGKTLLCQGTSNEYYIKNLPDSMTVVWTGSNNLVVQQNTPSSNHCAVSVLNNGTTSSSLTAKIYLDDHLMGTATLPVATQFYGSYSQDACAFYGVNHPAIPQSSLTATVAYFVHQGCLVRVKSGMFKGQTITHFGLTPDYWWQGQQEVQFKLPYMSGGTPFQIYCNKNGSSIDFALTFFTVTNNGNLKQAALDVQSTGSGYKLSIVDLGEPLQDEMQNAAVAPTMIATADGSVVDVDELEWGLEIFDMVTNRQVVATMVCGREYTLDTTGWTAGTYAVRAHVGSEVFTTKLLVK